MSLSRKATYYAKVLGHPPQLLQPLSAYFKIYPASAPLRFGGVIVGLQVVGVETKSWGDSGETNGLRQETWCQLTWAVSCRLHSWVPGEGTESPELPPPLPEAAEWWLGSALGIQPLGLEARTLCWRQEQRIREQRRRLDSQNPDSDC